MANRDICCVVCGQSGIRQALFTCSGCKHSQHLYCMHTNAVQLEPPETWLCEDCLPKEDKSSEIKLTGFTSYHAPSISEILRRRSYVNTMKDASSAKIKLLSQEEAIHLGEGTSNARSRSASLKKNAAAPAKSRMNVVAGRGSPQGLKGNDSAKRQSSRSILKTPLMEQKVQARGAGQDANGTKLVQGKSPLLASPSSALDKGKSPLGVPSAAKKHGQQAVRSGSAVSRGIVRQQPRVPVKRVPSAAASWSGSCKVYNASQELEAIHKLQAHPPSRVLKKVYVFSKSMPHLLQFELTPRRDIWVDIDQHLGGDQRDVALYFFPANKKRHDSYDQLLELMSAKDYAMRTRIDGMELLMFTSRVSSSNCKVWRGRHFLWGLFRKVGKPPQEEVDMSEDMDIDMVGGEEIPGKQDCVLPHAHPLHVSPPTHPLHAPPAQPLI